MIEPAVIVLRLFQYFGAAVLTGSSLLFVYALPASGAASAGLARWPRWLPVGAALLLAAAALLGLGAQSVLLSGSVAEGIKPETLSAVLSGMDLGKAAVIRAAAALSAALLLVLLPPARTGWIVAASLGLVATASLAWMGHGAATEGALGQLHLVSDILHAVAAAVWIGALVGFLGLLVARERSAEANEALHGALLRFSGLGSALVAVLVATGLINSWVLVAPDNLEALGTTRYGQLLSLKVMIFAGMLLLAGANRFRLAPALGRANAAGSSEAALIALRRSIALEAMLGFLVLVLVAWFGTLAPPASG